MCLYGKYTIMVRKMEVYCYDLSPGFSQKQMNDF